MRGRIRTLPDVVCVWCNQVFPMTNQRNASKYCSQEHANEAKRAAGWNTPEVATLIRDLVGQRVRHKQIRRDLARLHGLDLTKGQLEGVIFRMKNDV